MVENIRVSSTKAFSKSDVINLDQACIEIDKWCNQNVTPRLGKNEYIMVNFEFVENCVGRQERTEYCFVIYSKGSWSESDRYPYYEYYTWSDQGKNKTAVAIASIGKHAPLCKISPNNKFNLVRAWDKIKEEILEHLAAKEAERGIIEKFRA